MIHADEGLLICDLAETYNIYNYRALPLELVATLASGLHDNSRIKLKMASSKLDTQTMLMASILDHLSILLWTKTKDAQEGRNKPKSILNELLGVEEEKENDLITFDTMEEFEEIRRRIIEEKTWQQK